MDRIVAPEHLRAAQKVRGLLGIYQQKQDLVAIGAYSKGSDPRLDAALALLPDLSRFLNQSPAELSPFDKTVQALVRLGQRAPGP
jgi:flagellum-specific ATP synthase